MFELLSLLLIIWGVQEPLEKIESQKIEEPEIVYILSKEEKELFGIMYKLLD